MTNSTKNMNNNTILNFLKALEKIEERDFLFANAILNDDLINVFDDKYPVIARICNHKCSKP